MTRPGFRVRILGCGSSGGVPRVGGDWGACDPAEPKNTRTRCAILVERTTNADTWADNTTTRVLVDTPPDLRAQLLAARVRRLDAVLFTHHHGDQTHGIDDLRALSQGQKQRIPVHMDAPTTAELGMRFSYCFTRPEGSPYPPILTLHTDLVPGGEITVDGAGGPITGLVLNQDHGTIASLGFRFGSIGYSNDVVRLPLETLEALAGVETWIVDALRYTPHPTHANLALALEWIEIVRPRRAVLTNLHIDMDYQTLMAETPSHVEPGYDGMVLDGAPA